MRIQLIAALLVALILPSANAADITSHIAPPKSGIIKVAFVLSEGATVIDFAGPWDVFETVVLHGEGNAASSQPFRLYTVAPSKAPLHTSGGATPGMTVIPDYSFADAPTPDIVIIGAQSGGPGLSEWLQKMHADGKLLLSICTGVSGLADAGLLDGKSATTHHAYLDRLASTYPKVHVVRSVRYVQSDPIIFTSAGETSGIDLALHIVAEYYGVEVAQKTADYMEYQGTGWKTNQGFVDATKP
ncbi:MAG TPA: DJ-1/PfpI family protein [Gammaproteobacteria bacterium]|nr:DJ-1/PfpI family protein [Gammaproteobacteria bacterium]